MDLESTLIQAEALYRKFQRLVEAVDKKQNFPAPKEGDSSSQGDKGKQTEEKIISPELRRLLSRKVEVLSRTTVAQNGDGMPGK